MSTKKRPPFQTPVAPKPVSTIARDKLVHVIAVNRNLADSCARLLDHINKHPEIDADMTKVFGIQPAPALPQ